MPRRIAQLLPNQVSHKLIKLLNVVETIYIKSKNDILTLEKIKETIVKITSELDNYNIELNTSQFMKLLLKK